MKIPEQWTFRSADIATEFDRHVRSHLPWYDIATTAVRDVVSQFLPLGGHVYDIGAANGNVGRAIAVLLESRAASLTAIEPSEQMAATYRGPGAVRIKRAEDFDWCPFDVAVSMLSLMFIPPGRRGKVLSQIMSSCRPGGCLVAIEKMQPPTGYAGTVTMRLGLLAKAAAGVSHEEIAAKELSLSGMQRPMCRSEFESIGIVSDFFRYGDFAGYIIEPRNGR